MPRFQVEISGDGLERVLALLNGAGIPTIGPVFTWFGEQRPQQVRVGYQMLAVLDADNAEEAEAHVRDNLPDGDTTTLCQPSPGTAALVQLRLLTPRNRALHVEAVAVCRGWITAFFSGSAGTTTAFFRARVGPAPCRAQAGPPPSQTQVGSPPCRAQAGPAPPSRDQVA